MKILTICKMLLFTAVIIGSFTGCKKFTDIDPPEKRLTGVQVFADDKTAMSAIAGLYAAMGDFSALNNGMIARIGGLTGLSADEFRFSVNNPEYKQFEVNSLDASNNSSRKLWADAYKIIYYANDILENTSASSGLTEKTKNMIQGEVKLVRAYYFFYLVNLYGDVPLTLTTDYDKNRTMARTPSAEVYQQIVTDLRSSEALLGDTYPVSDRVRPNKWVAKAFLARVYLYLKQWALAEQMATELIGNNSFDLEKNLNTVFLSTSKEAIWQLYPAKGDGLQTSEFVYMPIGGAAPDFALTDDFLSTIEVGDKRKTSWVGTTAVKGQAYYYPAKYKQIQTGSLNPPEYLTLFRMSEQYLIRAEARVMQHKFDLAKEDLNKVRFRAGLGDLASPATEEAGIKAVLQERRMELFSECAHRWFDLKRTGMANKVLKSIKGTAWEDTDTLYPIHQSDLDFSPNLRQNPGYN
jgi:hypothetical protein